MEIWKNTSYPNYLASNLGRIKSIKRSDKLNREVPEKIISPLNHNTGYQFIWVHLDGKIKKQYVHRLVLSAFILNTENKPSVNHKNGIKTDNRLENLEWATWSEQLKHAYKIGLNKRAKGVDNPRHKKVAQYDSNGNLIKVWYGIRACARELGINYQQIRDVIIGRRNHAYGYKWRYIE